MVFKQPLHRDFLFLRVGLVDGLLARRQLFEFGQHLKELLDLASRLVGIEDLGRAANGRPNVLDVAGNEHGLASAEVKTLLANLQLHLALHDVNPFILFRVDTSR